MAAALNWNAKLVVDELGAEHANVQVIVRANTAIIRRSGDVVSQRVAVSAVTRPPGLPNRRSIEFLDGTVWTVDRKAGCGCR